MRGESNLGGLVNLSVSHDGTTAKIVLKGPDGAWFGVGFNAQAMKNLPYAIIVDGKGAVTERKLADHGPGTLLAPSIRIVSNSVVAGIRTVEISRLVAGITADHYSLPTTPGGIDVITAVGNTVELAYHKARTGAKIVLIPAIVSSFICAP